MAFGYSNPMNQDVNLGSDFNSMWKMRPGYQGLTDSKGNLNREYQVGNSYTISPWQQAAQNQINRNLSQNQGNLAVNSQSQTAGMMSQLAANGGLDSGARERIAQQANTDNLFGQQKLMSDAENVRNNVSMQDYQTQLGVDQFNKANAIDSMRGQNAFDLNQWQELMKAWGANKAADAMSESFKDKPYGLSNVGKNWFGAFTNNDFNLPNVSNPFNGGGFKF
jgi:hypothetical protein